jgi:hypothetical protein
VVVGEVFNGNVKGGIGDGCEEEFVVEEGGRSFGIGV